MVRIHQGAFVTPRLLREPTPNSGGGFVCPMTVDTRQVLCLLERHIAARLDNDPDLFRPWFCSGVQDQGKPAVEELLLDWLVPFLAEEGKVSNGYYWQETSSSSGAIRYICRSTSSGKFHKHQKCKDAGAVKPN